MAGNPFDQFDSPAPTRASNQLVGQSSAAGLSPAQAQVALERKQAYLEQHIAGLPPAAQEIARNNFFNIPLIAQLRVASAVPVSSRPNASAPPVTTKQQEIQNIARANVAARNPVTNAIGSVAATVLPVLRGVADQPGATNAWLSSALDTTSFGLGDKLRAAAGSLPLVGNGHSYEDNLALARAETQQSADQSKVGNILGTIGGSLPLAAGGGLPAAITREVPALAGMVNGGGKIGNVLRLAAGGAAGGAANAAGHDESIPQGAAIGAVAAPALVGVGKVAGWVGKQAAAVLNLGNAATILKRVTSATLPEIQAKLAAARANGVEPTLFELLPLQDRNKLAGKIVNQSDATLEATQRAIQPRLAAVGPEMATVTDQATSPGRAQVAQEMTDALTTARGTPEVAGDAAVAARATRQPDAMAAQPGREARLIMAPHDDTTLYNNIDELLPSHPELQKNGEVHDVPDDPAVIAMIRGKARLLTRKNADEASGGLTGRNVSDLLGELNSEAGNPNNPARDVARAAVQHIEGQLAETHPDFLDAHSQMTAAYAARRRMVEGASEGMKTRTQASRDPDAINQAATNAYASPEGASGRLIGQANRLQNTFVETALDPEQAIAATAKIPGNQAAIAQNLGPDAAGQILDAATTQREGMRALAGLNAKTGTNAPTMGAEELAASVLALNPASMIRTKIMGLHKIVQAFGVSDAKAGRLVELLFSNNPAKRQQVLDMLNRTPAGQSALAGIGASLGIGQAAQQMATPPAAPADVPAPQEVPVTEQVPTEDANPFDQFDAGPPPADVPPDAAPSPAPTSIEDMLKDPEVQKLLGEGGSSVPPYVASTESPEFAQLIHRQFNQESGNQHFDRSGRPKTSSAGAIGIAQVMPKTAPIAARMAGLPYDPNAYRNDPAYNKALGVAYMKAQLMHFGGDVAKALAAYNAGPGVVERAVSRHGDAWFDHVPAETQNYVANITG